MSCVQSSQRPLGFHPGLRPSWYCAAFDVVPLLSSMRANLGPDWLNPNPVSLMLFNTTYQLNVDLGGRKRLDCGVSAEMPLCCSFNRLS